MAQSSPGIARSLSGKGGDSVHEGLRRKLNTEISSDLTIGNAIGMLTEPFVVKYLLETKMKFMYRTIYTIMDNFKEYFSLRRRQICYLR